jgi:hypothetical protein
MIRRAGVHVRKSAILCAMSEKFPLIEAATLSSFISDISLITK